MSIPEILQSRPYNALWAQMSDLYGACGNPIKVSRTIIYGQEQMALARLLKVITYFIRCAGVKRLMQTPNLNKSNTNDQSKSFYCHGSYRAPNTKVLYKKRTEYQYCFPNELNNSNKEVSCNKTDTISKASIDENLTPLPITTLENNNINLRITNRSQDEVSGDVSEATEIDKINTIMSETSKICNDNVCIIKNDAILSKSVISNNKKSNISEKLPGKWSLWNMVSSTVKDGFSLPPLRNKSYNERISEDATDQINIDKYCFNDRHNLETLNTFEGTAIGTDRNDQYSSFYKRQKHKNDGVLFVLGDNEPLVNIKPITEKRIARFENFNYNEIDTERKVESSFYSKSMCDFYSTSSETLKRRIEYKSLINVRSLLPESNTSVDAADNDIREVSYSNITCDFTLLDQELRLLKLSLLSSNIMDIMEPLNLSSTGFVPSLFLDVTNHYISDVVLHVCIECNF